MPKFNRLLVAPLLLLLVAFSVPVRQVWLYVFSCISIVVTYLFIRERQRRLAAEALEQSYRRSMEPALAESAVHLHMATEAAQLGMWEYDLASGKTRGNDRLWKILGLDAKGQDGVVSHILDRIHKDDRAAMQALLIPSSESLSASSCEYRFQNFQGAEIWLESYGTPVLDAQGKATRILGVTRNINDRKLAQIDFQRSVDVSPAVLWITEKDGECTYLSQQWYSFTGQSHGESLGFGWLMAVHDEDRERASQLFAEANATHAPIYLEYRLRTKAGDYRWVIDAGHARYDATGSFLGYAGTIFDIHDKKLAQSQLEETAKQFKALANSIPQLVWMSDREGNPSWFNERWCDYTGTSTADVLGAGWEKVHHPDHGERVMQHLKQAFAKGDIWEDTFPLRSASGEWRWFLSRAYPLSNEAGQITQYFGTNTDITELRDFQMALVESETRFRDLANSMPQLVWTADGAGVVDYYNERASEFAGFRRREDGQWDWQPGLHPDDLDATVHAWREAVAHKKIYVSEHRVSMKDGSYRWHLSRAIPVMQADGVIKKWYGTATNIHEYKLALVELAKAKESAEEANKAKSRFLANMSHEIRSPMSSVLGYAELLLEKDLNDSDRLAFAASIRASGGHLLSIIDDILDLSAVESGEFSIDRHPFPVLDLIAESARSMSVLAHKKGLKLDVVFASAMPELIESDPLRFRQILLNLLSNAIKFTNHGQIVIRLRYEDELLQLEVEDSGMGIEPDKVDRLFHAFSQVDSSISRNFGGTGLGLHLSRRLAEAMGGDLSLNWSVPQKGSSFVLTLRTLVPHGAPFIASFHDSGASAKPAAAVMAQSCHVLLADDSLDNQLLIEIFLKKLGAQVDIVSNGEEAIQAAMKGGYDLVLMDMMMPVMDGLEATRRLRSLGFLQPIVALTAQALKEEVEKSIAAGCDHHLTKPIQLEVLRRMLEVILKNKADPKRSGTLLPH